MQQKQISLDQTTGIVCDCGGQLFQQALYLRKVSRFITNQDEDSIIPHPTFYCVACGVVPEQFDITKQPIVQP